VWISSADTISCCRAPRVLRRSSVEPCLGEEGPWRIWLCRMQRLASAVLRGRPVYGRPVRWRCACRTALRAFNCVYVCAHTQRPHRAVVVFVLAACERCAQRAHCVRAPCALALCLPYCPRSVRLCLCVRVHTKATSCPWSCSCSQLASAGHAGLRVVFVLTRRASTGHTCLLVTSVRA